MLLTRFEPKLAYVYTMHAYNCERLVNRDFSDVWRQQKDDDNISDVAYCIFERNSHWRHVDFVGGIVRGRCPGENISMAAVGMVIVIPMGMGMGTVMNPHGSVGILWEFSNGCEIKRKRVKYT